MPSFRISSLSAALGLAIVLAACGGGGESPTAASQDARRNALAAKTSLPISLPQDADPLLQGLTIPADAPSKGMWSTTQPWPMNGLHAALLPNGKVLTYGTPLNTPDTQDGRTYDLWTASLGFGATSHATSFDAGRVNSFCSTAAWLLDGRLLTTGGNSPLASAFVTAASGSVVNDVSPLADQRWYATMLTLPDGRNLIVGGMDPYSEGMVSNPDAAVANGTVSMTPEIYTAGTGWRSLTGATSRDAFGPDYLRASYPRAWVAPSGQVVGISAETLWSLDVAANGGAGAVRVTGKFKTPASNTAPVNVGATSSAVMYAPGKVLQVGGNGYFNGDGYLASNLATVVDFNGATPLLSETAPMGFARRYVNTVVLPDGKVLATGGTRVGNNGGADAVYEAEIWNPATGTWTVGARAAQVRVYHSATLLLPNATVLSTGGGAPGPVNNQNAEVYYPPYLFTMANGVAQLASRPSMTGISALGFAHGATMQIEMADAGTVSRLVLVANGVVTHSFNSTQRFQELGFTQTGDVLTATLPANANLAPPGHYQVFAVNAQGVPSRAVIVSLGLTVTTAPAVASLARDQAVAVESVAAPGQVIATDAGGLGVLGAAPNPAVAPAAAQFVVRDGLADAACVSLESAGAPGTWLRHANYRLQAGRSDGSAVFASDATFCPEAGLAGTGTTLRSKNYPTYVLRQRNAQLWLDPQAGDAGFLADASFRVRGTLPRGVPLTLGSVVPAGSAIGIDAGALAILQPLGTPPRTGELAATQFIARNGLADAACVSFERVSVAGSWLRHANYRLQTAASDGSALFQADATFCPEAGIAGNGVSLRSKNFQGSLVHQRDNQIWLDAQAADTAYAQAASFVPGIQPAGAALPVIGAIAAAPLPSKGTASYAPGLDALGLTFSWNFGDATPATAPSATSAVTHVYAAPGLYLVTLTVQTTDGRSTTKTFSQAVYGAVTATAPRASSAMLLEARNGASTRLWVVNPDNDSVSVFDTANNTRLAEIATGSAPRTIARAADGSVWVANRDSASISVISASTLAVTRSVALPRASQPWGLVIAADGKAYVSLEAIGQVLQLDGNNGATLKALSVGANPRHLSVTGDSARLLVSRFITPPLAGEGTATVDASSGGAEVRVVATATMSLQSTVLLRHSDKTDNEIQASGIPNYLGAAQISPDGSSAWVPSKQDNVKRGLLRNGLNLDFQDTVRAISSRIDLAALAETPAWRVDHDNASVASAAAFDATGSYLFVALETSRQVEVVSALNGARLFRIETGLAPQGVAVSADGTRLYVHNFMSRSVGVVDISPLLKNGEFRSTAVIAIGSVAKDKLAANVLVGKQLFYDARDTRLARDSYMSCASCHNDAGHDGRTWDFTGLGEGLRNTVALKGRAGIGQGFLHWSANFDEVQDFEGQIRNFAGGTGLMTDVQFNTGTRGQPLGDKKAGVSADLDALAAYLASLKTFAPSPFRNADGNLSATALAGRAVFQSANCAACHGGSAFTNSAGAGGLKNVGTLKPSSGKRLGATLTGIDIPTLRDAWASAPYLHDGSAASLSDAIKAHNNVTLNATDLANVADYVRQIGAEELAFGSVACAIDNGKCNLPPSAVATVYYGAPGFSYLSKAGLSGNVSCTAATFGGTDPAPGVTKTCAYVVSSVSAPPAGQSCATQGGTCVIPVNTTATVSYGASGSYLSKAGLSGSIGCSNTTFGDPQPSASKSCSYVVTAVALPPAGVACAKENANCVIPNGKVATVSYGANGNVLAKAGLSGTIACNNAGFGDPAPGVVKSCTYVLTR